MNSYFHQFHYLKNFIILLVSLIAISCTYQKVEQHQQDRPNFNFSKTFYNLEIEQDSIEFTNWLDQFHLDQALPNIIMDTLKSDTTFLGLGMFEDDKYSAYRDCFGEFGGKIYFIEKNSPKYVYFLPSTCPLMIDKRTDGYYITETLAHGFGSTTIRKFRSIQQLPKVEKDSLLLDWKKYKFPNEYEYEIDSIFNTIGEQVLDTIGFTTDIFFNYRSEDFLIYSDYDYTYLGRFKNQTVELLDTLIKSPSWGYDLNSFKINDSTYHYNYSGYSGYSDKKIKEQRWFAGDIFIMGNSIVIGYRYREQLKELKQE